jgi:hypothetical protein
MRPDMPLDLVRIDHDKKKNEKNDFVEKRMLYGDRDGEERPGGSLACPQVVETLLDSVCAKGAWPYPAQILESPIYGDLLLEVF